MKTKHTKEEWKISSVLSDRHQITILSKSRIIAEVVKWGDNKQEIEANAKLIAAAPELLEELILLLKYVEDLGNLEGYWPENEQIHDCKRAIKKATE